MNNLKYQRMRRSKQTRFKIAELKMVRFSVHRTNQHIYAQLIDIDGKSVITSTSSLDISIRNELKNGGNISAAKLIGRRIAEKAKDHNIVSVAFDRSGNRYHGRVKALADAARENGLKF